ncbi:hypothetical protein [Pseudomonas syringae]|nr:hypothetical protein [Pseudomonas syringae]
MLGLVALQTSIHVMARAVAFYAELFPSGRTALKMSPEQAQNVAYFWGFTNVDMDPLYEEPSGEDL